MREPTLKFVPLALVYISQYLYKRAYVPCEFVTPSLHSRKAWNQMQVSNLKMLKKIMYEQLITCDLRDLDGAFLAKNEKLISLPSLVKHHHLILGPL